MREPGNNKLQPIGHDVDPRSTEQWENQKTRAQAVRQD